MFRPTCYHAMGLCHILLQEKMMSSYIATMVHKRKYPQVVKTYIFRHMPTSTTFCQLGIEHARKCIHRGSVVRCTAIYQDLLGISFFFGFGYKLFAHCAFLIYFIIMITNLFFFLILPRGSLDSSTQNRSFYLKINDIVIEKFTVSESNIVTFAESNSIL